MSRAPHPMMVDTEIGELSPRERIVRQIHTRRKAQSYVTVPR